MTPSEQSSVENRAQDPWTVGEFRVVPVMDGQQRISVDIECLDRGQQRISVDIECLDRMVTLSTGEVLELAEHLIRVARMAEAWRGRRS